MNKTYNRINWENYPSDKTPLNENNLNKIDVAVNTIDDRVITHEEVKATKVEVAPLIKEISFNESNGIFTITRKNGSKFTVDTKLEKIAINFGYDPLTQQISLILIDGTVQYIDLSALITEYEFLDTDTVSFFIDESGKVSAIVKEGSIEEKHLRPNYLAEIKVESAKAESAATAAAASASTASSKASEASASATSAAKSATTATQKATAAATSATNAANSANTATTKASEALTSATNAANSATTASNSATTATNKANEALTSSSQAATSATNADTYAKKSQSYAVGTGSVRPNEATDNAKYYYEQAKSISESFAGALRPMGTVMFENLPTLSSTTEGDMYNISNQFITTSEFKEGVGNIIPAGANVYKTADNYWDVLAGSPVTGVKGNAESTYRKGNVNITKANIGLGNVNNTADSDKSVKNADTVDGKHASDLLEKNNPSGKGSIVIGAKRDGSVSSIFYCFGEDNYFSANYSIAAGAWHNVYGVYAIAAGYKNTVYKYAAVFGELNQATQYGITAGLNNIGNDYAAVFGKYNEKNTNAMFIIGNGESSSERKNIFTVEKSGKTLCAALEVYSITPYIDFHYNNSTADNTARIIQVAEKVLEVQNIGAFTLRNSNLHTIGNTGWYNETHGGGWYMLDDDWVRTFNNKKVYTQSIVRADGGFQAVTPSGTEYAVLSVNAQVYRLQIGANSTGNYIEINGSYGINMWISDTRLKENLLPTTVTSALDKVNALDFIQFDWKNTEYNESIPEKDQHKDIGLSANQVQEIIPSAVFEVGEDKIKNINNSEMTIYALKAIQELSDIVKKQEEKIRELEKKIQNLNL